MVVEAGVVPWHPADQPGLHGRLVQHALEDPLLRVMPHERLPARRLGGKLLDEPAQLRPAQIHPINLAGAANERSSSGAIDGGATGRSEPYTSCSRPTALVIAAIATGP